MKKSLISLPSAWGRNVEHKYFSGSEKSLAVFFPGSHYSCDRPLLNYASQSAIEHGYDLLQLEYGYQSARIPFDWKDLSILVFECKHAIDQIRDKYETISFVSKSLGTLAAGQVGEIIGRDKVRQLFLTPINNTVPYIRESDCTVIYGTADPLFSSENVDYIHNLEHVKVRPIEHADHSLELETLEKSIVLLRQITEMFADFFSDVPPNRRRD
ncbi:hypothetical protein [Paenibacillus caui]|uniref:hypothetical protein n=1 Tax=Paenibacillus caui TaxID=2873927 RepID=UPI001CA80B17|nr:hypothetical protein [Paenibacillus caui]